jgi:hypothetical protein
MPALVSWRRFGMAVIGASATVSAFGLLLHIRDATPAPQSPALPQSAALLEKAATPIGVDDPVVVQSVVDQFVEALARRNEADMRRLFPAMTGREARILFGIRTRLGAGAELRAETKRMSRATGAAVEVDFAIRARPGDRDRERYLPFTALVRADRGSWQIVQLR